MSIDLFKYQDDHSRLMDEMDFQAGMWTVFAASAGVAYFLTFVSSGHVASFVRAKYQTQYFESFILQRAEYFDQHGNSHGTPVSRVRDDPLKLEEIMAPILPRSVSLLAISSAGSRWPWLIDGSSPSSLWVL